MVKRIGQMFKDREGGIDLKKTYYVVIDSKFAGYAILLAKRKVAFFPPVLGIELET